MRRILVASALLVPVLASAAAYASRPVTEESASTTRPISTGVTPARVLYSPTVELTPGAANTLPADAKVVLSLNVDAKGLPTDVQVVSSPSQLLVGPVLDAVRQYRFRPASLNNQPVATPMTLTVVVQH